MLLVPHPFADLRPPLQPNEYKNLVRSIGSVGLDQAIVLYRGSILDGRHRYRACEELGVVIDDTKMRPFEGTDVEALAYVQRTDNWHDLTVSQKSLTAARVFEAGRGIGGGETQAQLAARYGISPRLIRTSCAIVNREPKLAEFIASREVSTHAASTLLADAARLGQYLAADASERKRLLRASKPRDAVVIKTIQAVSRYKANDIKSVLAALDENDRLAVIALHRAVRSVAGVLQNMAQKAASAPAMAAGLTAGSGDLPQ